MIQKTFIVTSEADILLMIDWLKSDLAYQNARGKFAQIYFSRFDAVEAETIVHVLKKNAPELQIAGISLHGDIFCKLNEEKLIKFNFCFFSEAEVTVLDYDGTECSDEEIARGFRQQLSRTSNPKAVLLLPAGLTFRISALMDKLTAGFDDIYFFGTMASIHLADISTMEAYAFGSRFVMKGLVAVIFSGEGLSIHTESLFSWNPVGKEMDVSVVPSSGDAFGDSTIRAIDGLPAVQTYKKYLNVEQGPLFTVNICEFPLVVKRNGCLLPRVPFSFNGELYTSGDIREGEKISFTYGKCGEILQKSKEAAGRMRDFLPEAVFLFVCPNRAIFLRERAHEEIDFFRSINPALLYGHGLAELYSYQGKGGVFNSQLVAVGMREGNSIEVQHLDESLELMGISFAQPQDSMQAAGAKPQGFGMAGMGNNAGQQLIPLADRLVTFLEATTEELRKMALAANAASEAKSAFLSNMSHEIRSPLNAVLGLNEIIMRESSEESVRSYALDIQSSGKSLLAIINDILDFSKIEAGKMEIIDADYDLRMLLSDLVNMIESRARKKGLEFITDVDPDIPCKLYGDETRIKQCVLNILTNAVKYTPKGSVTLSVRYRQTDANHIALRFDVADTGIGIKEENLEKLCKPFERIEEKRNRAIEGTGLGMSIVTKLLAQMGSSLSVQSVYGKGSEFSFTLEQEVRGQERTGSQEEARASLLRESASYRESFQAPEARVLVVDDTPLNITVFRGLVRSMRIQVDSAADGEAGLAAASKTPYHLIFIDHLMPKMDGIEMLRRLREDSSGPNAGTPCIALTANAISGSKERYLAAGFSAYLSKPIDSASLEAQLAQFLPAQLQKHRGDEGFAESAPQGGAARHSAGADPIVAELFGIDSAQALKNCGSTATFRETVLIFKESIGEKSALIERYAAERDWRNYTILVHALKSSARLIGAQGLSELAQELEAAGNKAQQADKDAQTLIAEKTPALLASYRAYAKKLAPLCGTGTGQPQKPPLSRKAMEEALAALRETVEAFDFATADAIIAELDAGAIPDAYAEQYAAVRSRVKAVDRDGVLALLQGGKDA